MLRSTKRMNISCFVLYFVLSGFLIPGILQARAVDEVKFKTLPDGYRITVNFLSAIQYQSHAPANPAKEFYIQLKTVDFRNLTDQEIDSLRERLTWGPDPNIGIPLQEIIFEGGDPERPQMTFLFTEGVECDVRSSSDLRSLIIKVKTKEPPAAIPAQAEKISVKPQEKDTGGVLLPEKVIPEDKNSAQLMEDARDALTKGRYEVSIGLYTKILLTAQGPVKQQAQELLGVARERNGQLAHAKAEYQKYLEQFPDGPDALRVRQRLAGIVTAAKTPQEKLKPAKRSSSAGKGKWVAQNFGSLSQFYFRDQTIPEGADVQVNRSDLSTDLDLNSRWKSDDLDINGRFTGGHLNNFLPDRQDQDKISALSLEMRSKKNGWSGKFGRQSLSSGGVLGRFDGAHASIKLNPVIKLNGVFGYPVESVRKTVVSTNKRFYGMNLDFGTFLQKWDFNTFFINQENYGLVDRRAIGAETRYFDQLKAFFTLLDYDIFFNALDIFLFNGHWTLPTKTTLNLILDYRKSPILTLNNAIQGQGVDKISDLFNSYTEAQLKQLARDRTTHSKSATFGITQDLKKDLQLVGEVTVSEMGGTVSSGGVEGQEALGKEYTYSAGLITSNVFKENDVIISGLSYLNAAQSNVYSLSLSGSFPLTVKTRLMPRFRLDYRQAKGGDDSRVTVRPALRMDYNFTRWAHFEAEGGFELLNGKSSGISQKSTETFISLGYRLSF